MTTTEITRKIAGIDAQLCSDLYERKLTPEQRAKLRIKRDNLEKKLYKSL